MEEALTDVQEANEQLQNQHWAQTAGFSDLLSSTSPPPPEANGPKDKLHEFLGQTIIQETSLAHILETGDFSPLDVAAIAMGKTGELDPGIPQFSCDALEGLTTFSSGLESLKVQESLMSLAENVMSHLVKAAIVNWTGPQKADQFISHILAIEALIGDSSPGLSVWLASLNLT